MAQVPSTEITFGAAPAPVLEPLATGGGLDLRALFRIASRRKLIIVGAVLTAMALAAAILARIPALYSAEAVLVLDARKVHVVDLDQVVSSLPPDSSVVNTELNVISSRSMAERVVDRLSLTSHAQSRNGAAGNRAPKDKDGPEEIVAWLSSRLGSAMFYARTAIAGLWPGVADQDSEMPIRARPESLPEAEEPSKADLVDSLLGGLRVSTDGESYTIYIDFTSADPQFAATVSNAFATEYLASQTAAKSEATKRATLWLQGRLAQLRRELMESERTVQAYREGNGLFQSKGATLGEQQLEDINAQLVAARGDRVVAEAQLATAQEAARKGRSLEALSNVIDSPVIQHLRQHATEIRLREAAIRNLKTPEHPELLTVESDLESVRAQIREEVRRIIQGLSNNVDAARAREHSLEDALEKLEQKVGKGERAEVGLQQLVREADANRALYEVLLSRYKETSAQQELHEPEARIISYAEAPTVPSYPRVRPILGLAAVMGILVGGLLAVIAERLDRTFRVSSDIENYTGLPVLGMIPSVPALRCARPEDYVLKRPASLLNEALRTAQVALQLSQRRDLIKVIVVTSAVPREGKTAFCLSLARSCAADGRRVLLIDADLRRSGAAAALGGHHLSGIAELLRDEKSLPEVLKVDRKSGAHYIPTSLGTSNPAMLLGSDRMGSLLNQLRRAYELIIIDTPPFHTATDAALIARYADVCLLSVRWGDTPREVVLGALRRLNLCRIDVAGIILSRINLRKQRRYGPNDEYYG